MLTNNEWIHYRVLSNLPLDDPETLHWGPFHLARQSFLILLELFNLDIERENSPVMFGLYPRMPEVRLLPGWREGERGLSRK